LLDTLPLAPAGPHTGPVTEILHADISFGAPACGFPLLFAVGAADAAISLDQAAAPATNGVPRFDISRFDVEGNTLLDASRCRPCSVHGPPA
jgi:hypothetical protein